MALKNYIEERILASARKLFEQNGFADTDMKAISRDAEIAVGTIYNYFESKNTLFERIIVENWEKSIEDLQSILNSEQNSKENVKMLINEIYNCVEKQKTLMIEIHSTEGHRPGKFKEMMERMRVVKQILSKALDNKPDASRIAETIISVIPRFIRHNPKEKQENLEFLYRLANML